MRTRRYACKQVASSLVLSMVLVGAVVASSLLLGGVVGGAGHEYACCKAMARIEEPDAAWKRCPFCGVPRPESVSP